MLTGNAYLRTSTNTTEAKMITWLWCVLDWSQPSAVLMAHRSISNNGQTQSQGLTKTDCDVSLRAQIFFPSCWDGVNLDSADHKSHMAYPSQGDNGDCPSSHPVQLIALFYEIWYAVSPFNQLTDGGRFVLSNGDPTGMFSASSDDIC